MLVRAATLLGPGTEIEHASFASLGSLFMDGSSPQFWLRFFIAIGGAIAFHASSTKLIAQCEMQKLIASDVSRLDHFGVSVSLSGDRAIVGALEADCPAGSSCGSAYVYRYDGMAWIQEQKLTASDGASNDYFGSSVSVSGDRAIVGARWDDCPAGGHCGSAYVYRYDGTTWVQEQKLTPSDAVPGDDFGLSVSVSADTAIVGARWDNCPGGYDCGAVYTYRYDGTNWVQEQKLTASDAAPGDAFGRSISLSGDRVIVGALYDDCPGVPHTNCGAAYVYRYNGTTWAQEQKLTASDAAQEDLFGVSVSLSGDRAIVGASFDDCPPIYNCGSAYVYRYDETTWVQEQKLTASDGARDDRFGFSISLSGDRAIVGAYWDDCLAGPNCGSAYVYRYDGTTWVQEQKLTASDAAEDDTFGLSVSLSGDRAIVGAFHDDCSAGSECGSAYVFALGPDCNENGQADYCDIRDGGIPDVDQDGVPDECEPVALDIRPGACPNPLNPRSRGVLPVAVVGSDIFDVTQIDKESLVLRRADGVGGSVPPLSHRHGPRVKVKDVATPFSGPLCDCHELRGDGIDDLGMKFSTRKLVRSLELASVSPGTEVPLTLSGTLRDGTPFEASDCIVITGGSRNGDADAADGWPTSSEVGESILRSLRRSQD